MSDTSRKRISPHHLPRICKRQGHAPIRVCLNAATRMEGPPRGVTICARCWRLLESWVMVPTFWSKEV